MRCSKLERFHIVTYFGYSFETTQLFCSLIMTCFILIIEGHIKIPDKKVSPLMQVRQVRQVTKVRQLCQAKQLQQARQVRQVTIK
jgi:hypothetical protein